MTKITDIEFVEIFSGLNSGQLDSVCKVIKEQTYNYGAVIFEESSPSKEFYIIAEGTIDIQIDPDLILPGDDYDPGTIARLQQGQTFGEIALVDEGVRSASAKCSSNSCRLLVIDRSDLMNLLAGDRDMGFKVMSNLAAELSLKIRQTNLIVRESLIYTPSSREEDSD